MSEELHTPPLPVTHVFLGYCWSYSRFTILAVQLTRPNNDTPSFRSYRFANPLPLTGRNLTVIRSMQCELSENVLYRDSYERDPANLYRLSLR